MTRATNRAIADLIGAGEVTAEEMMAEELMAKKERARQKQKKEPVEVIDVEAE